MAIYAVSKGKTAYIMQVITCVEKAQSSVFSLQCRDNTIENAAWRTTAIRNLYQNNIDITYMIPRRITEMTDIVMFAKAESAGTAGSASFMILLKDN